MNQTLASIDWTPTNCFRMAAVLLQTVLVLQFVMMLSHYYWRIMPLRKRHDVLAPPVGWTFAFHLILAIYMATTAISTFQRVAFDDAGHPTLNTWVTPPIALALIVVVNKFLRYYSKGLNEAEDRANHFHR